ncbi:MAG: hypothetical protein EXS31_06955, partial [Pedosphaera sp.]|nr:hypothetical protein [Pedosphaera sp.]
MNSDALALAKDRLRIPELWKLLGLPGEPGKSCHVPYREDKNPSGSVYDEGRRFHDHATGEDFDAIDFLARVRGLSVADAIREFIRLAGVDEPSPPAQHSHLPPAIPPPHFDWWACVAALTSEQRVKLAEWRGYSIEFVNWLHAQRLLGLFDKERIAFPVEDAEG